MRESIGQLNTKFICRLSLIIFFVLFNPLFRAFQVESIASVSDFQKKDKLAFSANLNKTIASYSEYLDLDLTTSIINDFLSIFFYSNLVKSRSHYLYLAIPSIYKFKVDKSRAPPERYY